MSTITYGFETTAAEVAAGIDLSGKRAIVTGGSSGIVAREVGWTSGGSSGASSTSTASPVEVHATRSNTTSRTDSVEDGSFASTRG